MPPLSTHLFDFTLPPHLVAQQPIPQRDQSRLLVLDRSAARIAHQPRFRDILAYLRPGDVLVLNDSQVIPARLRGRKPSGGEIEVLLLQEVAENEWWVMLRPGRRVRAGNRLIFSRPPSPAAVTAQVLEKNAEGHCRLQFSGPRNLTSLLPELGEIPLPPYIERPPEAQDWERYQTIYARQPGSIAAPTAGLHWSESLLREARHMGVEIRYVTLHVGLGTFAPVKAEDVSGHRMHAERYELTAETALAINAARSEGRRIIAVGTTTVRVLESAAAAGGGLPRPGRGQTQIFIYPPFSFRVVDALVTNFHLPRSTLLMLVSAFAAPGRTEGRELVLTAYAAAVQEQYRFFSYGDAMLIV